MSLPYSEKVIEHFQNPRNVGEIKNPDARATEGSPACGDMVKLSLKVDPKTKKIKDIKFQSYGCASNIATASIITEMAKGKTIDEAKKITWDNAAKSLGGLPPVKVHCAVLAVSVLKTAIENYEHSHGLVKDKKPTDIKVIKNRLSHVINPLTGFDIQHGKLTHDIGIEDGVVTVKVDLKKDHQFAANIKQEITEILEPLWDVKKVNVIFTLGD